MVQTPVAPKKKRIKPAVQPLAGTPVPDYLIYEVVAGKPLYYKGYKQVIKGTKTLEEVKMESQLQAGLKARISAFIGLILLKLGYEIASGELGLNLSKNDKRGADFAIYKAENWSWQPKCSNLPPEVIIEIDVQAEMENMTEMDYMQGKIKDYLAFGVKKVIWIFTKERLVFIATAQLPWLTYDWSANVEVVEGVAFCINDLVKPV
jgi:hypothetical protein